MLIPKCTCNTRVITQQVTQPLVINRFSLFIPLTVTASSLPSASSIHRGRKHSRKVKLPLII